jgi:hypothetical protein
MLATPIFYQHTACNREKNFVMNGKLHCSKLHLIYWSISLNPPILLYDLIHLSLCVTWCVFTWLWCANKLLHTTQLYARSPICMGRCLLRLLRTLNDLLHTSQLKGCSPLCMCWCDLREPWRLDDLLHTSLQSGLSPLSMTWCVLHWWALRLHCWVNDLSHSSQEYRRSPLHTGWSSFRVLCKTEGSNMKNTPMKRNNSETHEHTEVKRVGLKE